MFAGNGWLKHLSNMRRGTENGAALLDWFFETVRYVYDRCADDVQKHCAGTEFGGGRILSCLIEKSSELTDACKEVTAEFSGRLE